MRGRSVFRIDGHTIFLLVTLLGSGSLLISTLTNDAEEIRAEEFVPASASPEPVLSASPPTQPKKSACLTDEASIQDLQELRRKLAVKEEELKAREAEILARETALKHELGKIDELRGEIARLQNVGESRNEEKIAKLVETFEAMSPKAAAPIVSGVDEGLAVEAMSRISSEKLGKILAAMEPSKSTSIAEKIAGVVRAKNSATRGTASIGVDRTTNRMKGGEKDGNRKHDDNDVISNGKPSPAVGG